MFVIFIIYILFMMNILGSYSGVNSSICLLREVTIPELVVDRAKLDALSIDDLMGSICVNLIDDIRSFPFGGELAPVL